MHEMHFIGVTTSQSIIQKIFPLWMDKLGVAMSLHGIDLTLNSKPNSYREAILEIKSNPNIRGALITTHKIPVYESTKELFDVLMPSALEFGEIGCVFKHGESLYGEATDVITVKKAFLEIWNDSNRRIYPALQVCILGCGGAGIALANALLSDEFSNVKTIILTDVADSRIANAKNILGKLDKNNIISYKKVNSTEDNDKIIENLNKGAVIVNATGMGKDRPGSPISEDVRFPAESCVWEYNYRGNLLFMEYALAQQSTYNLYVVDGFRYFIYGWTTVISRVIDKDINKILFDELADIAFNVLRK